MADRGDDLAPLIVAVKRKRLLRNWIDVAGGAHALIEHLMQLLNLGDDGGSLAQVAHDLLRGTQDTAMIQLKLEHRESYAVERRQLGGLDRARENALVGAKPGRLVGVGCAAGADAFVRSSAPSALVWRASALPALPRRASFAARSVALVGAVAAGAVGSALVGFVSSPLSLLVLPSAP